MCSQLIDGPISYEETIADRFHVKEKIGSGGMGTVFLAYDDLLSKDIALKILRTTLNDDRRSAERLLREAEVMRELRHPNLVQTFDVGLWRNMPYFTMEFVGGGDLAERIQNEPLSWEMAISVIKQMSRGLAEVHLHEILHRDLKLSNILIDGELIKISDFGLAYNGVSNLTMSTEMVGSPASFPPELIKDRLYSELSDIYALGVASYELVTGKPPFTGDSIGELIGQILHVDPEPPHHLVDVPEEISRTIMAMLHKNPDHRPSSAHEIAANIEMFTADNKIPLTNLSLRTSTKTAVKRKKPSALLGRVNLIGSLCLTVALTVACHYSVNVLAEESSSFKAIGYLFSLFVTTGMYALLHWHLFRTVLKTETSAFSFLKRSLRLTTGIYLAYVFICLVLSPKLDFTALLLAFEQGGSLAVMSVVCILSLTPLDLNSWFSVQEFTPMVGSSLAMTVLLPTYLITWDALHYVITSALCNERLSRLRNERKAQAITKQFFVLLAAELITLEVLATKFEAPVIFGVSLFIGLVNMTALYITILKSKV